MSSGWWIANFWQSGQTVLLASWIIWVIVSICLHELGHGVAAIWEGDDTPRIKGHMTFNPLVHMGGPSLIVFLLIGFAWGLMPVNPYNFRHRRWGEAIVAAAGPAVNLILAVILLTTAGIVSGLFLSKDPQPEWAVNLFTFLLIGGWLNLILLALNLLPIPPLDGSRILASFSDPYARLLMNPQSQLIGLGIFVIIMVSGVGNVFTGLMMSISDNWAGMVQGVIMRLTGG